MQEVPEEFIEYAFRERRDSIKKILSGDIEKGDLPLGFTRHTPAIISYGPAGVNGSIKGIGFVHRKKYLKDTIHELEEFRGGYTKEALEILLKHVYVEEKVDFSKLSTLEMAGKHSWKNFKQNPEASILFYTPPHTSYEVRAEVEIHQEGPYWEYVNLVHDAFHTTGTEEKRNWKGTPTYIFLIKEIYNNSPDKMGVRIF